MPRCWLPWPGNTNATVGFFTASSSSSRSSSSGKRFSKMLATTERFCIPGSMASVAGTTTALRSGSMLRPVWSVKAVLAMEGVPSDGLRRLAVRRSAALFRADGLFADSGTTWNGMRGAAGAAAGAGAASSTTCALVPPMPKELTPARSGLACVFQVISSLLTKNGLLLRSIFGLSFWKLATGTSSRLWSIMSVLMKPVAPAAQFA
mmetsp:Transcript_61774/g.162265  ORF Transcript_61774/g.162265 Transcript_61774/m.162265 type:complete len:206 (-) Transcript_61774:255-872(-)